MRKQLYRNEWQKHQVYNDNQMKGFHVFSGCLQLCGCANRSCLSVSDPGRRCVVVNVFLLIY